jgi:hypothetical protein
MFWEGGMKSNYYNIATCNVSIQCIIAKINNNSCWQLGKQEKVKLMFLRQQI